MHRKKKSKQKQKQKQKTDRFFVNKQRYMKEKPDSQMFTIT